MLLKIGSYYKTRGGNVLGPLTSGDSDFPFLFVTNYGFSYSWKADGSFMDIKILGNHTHDLVLECNADGTPIEEWVVQDRVPARVGDWGAFCRSDEKDPKPLWEFVPSSTGLGCMNGSRSNSGIMYVWCQKADLPPMIPSGVYYSAEWDNFYDLDSLGMGMKFYTEWKDHKNRFPQTPESCKYSSISQPEIKIQADKYYETRSGETVGPIRRSNRNNGYEFTAYLPAMNGYRLWHANGSYLGSSTICQYDLVKEVSAPVSVSQESKGVTMVAPCPIPNNPNEPAMPTALDTVVSVAKIGGRFLAKTINYLYVETTFNVVHRLMLTVRYVVLASTLTLAASGYYFPTQTKAFVKSLIPKVTIERPEIMK